MGTGTKTMAFLHSRFSSDESQRYAAECKRLAALSRNGKAARQRQATKQQPASAGWFGSMFGSQRKLSAKYAR